MQVLVLVLLTLKALRFSKDMLYDFKAELTSIFCLPLCVPKITKILKELLVVTIDNNLKVVMLAQRKIIGVIIEI